MSTNLNTRGMLLRDIEIAQVEMRQACDSYDAAAKKTQDAQRVSHAAYDARAAAVRKLDRLRRALAVLDGEEDDRG